MPSWVSVILAYLFGSHTGAEAVKQQIALKNAQVSEEISDHVAKAEVDAPHTVDDAVQRLLDGTA